MIKRLLGGFALTAAAISFTFGAVEARQSKVWGCHWDDDEEVYVLIHPSVKGWERGHLKNHELDFAFFGDEAAPIAVDSDTDCNDVTPILND